MTRAGNAEAQARSRDLLSSFALPPGAGASSLATVLVALTANLLVAVAKLIAAIVTGSASMLAEAAHSWAGTGREVFLPHLAVRPRALEAKICASPAVAGTVLSLSAPDEPSLEV